MVAVDLQHLPGDDPLYNTLCMASEDFSQGLIYECLRKLVQGEEWVKGDDLFLPSGKSREFLLGDLRRLNVMWGAVRSSKTVTANLFWLHYNATHPRAKPFMIGQTLDTIRDNVINPLEELLPSAVNYTTGWRDCYIFGVRNKLRSASSKAQDKKLKGPTASAIYGDEVTTWPENVLKMALSRISTPGAFGLFTTNPESQAHHVYRDYLSDEAMERLNAPGLGGVAAWQFTLADNPGLTEEYIASLKAEYPPGTVWHKRYILGLWAAAEGLVYDFFTTSPADGYVVSEIPCDLQSWIIGADYGTTNPTTWILAGYSPSLREWVVTSEYWWSSRETRRQKTDREYTNDLAKFISERNNPLLRAVMVDPAAASWITDMRKARMESPKYGYVQHVRGADNSVLDGIRDAMTLLHTHRIRIYGPGCPHLVEGLQGYLWDEKAAEKGEDKPLKDGGSNYNDHSCDAFRYLCREVKRLGY